MYKYYDSFDCGIQCEEFFKTHGVVDMEEDSEDVLDRCEIVSLEDIREDRAYRMEDEVAEELDMANFWDYSVHPEELIGRIRVGRIN